MAKVVKTFISSKEGIIQILEVSSKERDCRVYFYAKWSPDFVVAVRVENSVADTIAGTISRVKEWDPKIEELYDLGDFPVFAREEPDKTLTINLKEFSGCNKKMRACEVPIGSFLDGTSDYFFRYYKGFGSVKNLRLMI